MISDESYEESRSLYKQHGGPLTESHIERLSGLSDEQVLTEAYLKHTIAQIFASKGEKDYIL